MAYTLQLTKREQVTLDAGVADRLIASGNGDAALLYLCILRHDGRLSDEDAARELHFSVSRRAEAEEGLRRLGLLGENLPAAETPAPENAPAYSSADVAEAMERGDEFAVLTRAVAQKLNKLSLTTAECRSLLTLYDYLSLPPEVIFSLVQYCILQYEKRYGKGRRPTVRAVEKEGFRWHRAGIDTAERVDAYVRRMAAHTRAYPRYMEVLQMPDRVPAPAEEKYLDEWIEMGFPPETVALAYDKTVLKCHELKWGYLTAILRRWHSHGWHTVEAVRRGDAPGRKRTQTQQDEWEELQEYAWRAYRGGERNGT